MVWPLKGKIKDSEAKKSGGHVHRGDAHLAYLLQGPCSWILGFICSHYGSQEANRRLVPGRHLFEGQVLPTPSRRHSLVRCAEVPDMQLLGEFAVLQFRGIGFRS